MGKGAIEKQKCALRGRWESRDQAREELGELTGVVIGREEEGKWI